MQRHVIDRPRDTPGAAQLIKFVEVERRGLDHWWFARTRPREEAPGAARLQHYLRIARGRSA